MIENYGHIGKEPKRFENVKLNTVWRTARFAETEQDVAQMLEVAGAVGIAARAINDPEVAADDYRKSAAQLNDERVGSKVNPDDWAETARERVAAGETYVAFTFTGVGNMAPFIDEYERRFGVRP
jgi:hypothetical protein